MKKEGFRRVGRDVKQLTCVPVKLLAKCNDWKCWSKENVCCGSKNPGKFTGITNNQLWQSPHAYFISCITDSNKQTCKQTMLTEMHTDSNKCCSKCSIARENNTRHIFKTKKPLLLFVCTRRRTQAHINSAFPSSLSLCLHYKRATNCVVQLVVTPNNKVLLTYYIKRKQVTTTGKPNQSEKGREIHRVLLFPILTNPQANSNLSLKQINTYSQSWGRQSNLAGSMQNGHLRPF